MLTTADLIEALTGRRFPADQAISHAERDSRLVQPGALFVALPGENVDGHDFISAAFANGALVALAQQDVSANFSRLDLRGDIADAAITYPLVLRVVNTLEALQQIARFWVARLKTRVIAITGSVGKSSTKEVTHAVLSQRFKTLKNPGNLNNEIGLPLSVLSLTQDHQRAVLEMGFYVPEEIRFLCHIAPPSIGVVTNIGHVHAERAGSQDEIARGKQELVESLSPGGWALLNADDPRVLAMVDHTPAQVLTYAVNNNAADLTASEIHPRGLDGLELTLNYLGQAHTIRTPLLGRHSAYTVLAAAGVGLVEGLSWDEIAAGLAGVEGQLRLVAREMASGALLLDDTYNAEPQSTVAALDLLADLEGRHIAVLGDMLELGIYEEAGHQRVGQHAAAIVDLLVTVGPRAHTIASAARKAGLDPARVVETGAIEEVVDYLEGRTGPGDIVLVKGSNALRMNRLVPMLIGEGAQIS